MKCKNCGHKIIDGNSPTGYVHWHGNSGLSGDDRGFCFREVNKFNGDICNCCCPEPTEADGK